MSVNLFLFKRKELTPKLFVQKSFYNESFNLNFKMYKISVYDVSKKIWFMKIFIEMISIFSLCLV